RGDGPARRRHDGGAVLQLVLEALLLDRRPLQVERGELRARPGACRLLVEARRGEIARKRDAGAAQALELRHRLHAGVALAIGRGAREEPDRLELARAIHAARGELDARRLRLHLAIERLALALEAVHAFGRGGLLAGCGLRRGRALPSERAAALEQALGDRAPDRSARGALARVGERRDERVARDLVALGDAHAL